MGAITGFVTKYALIALVMFSGYKGNAPIFSELLLEQTSHYIQVNSTLQNAFEEDFETLFQSGQEIPIWFDIKLYENKKIVSIDTFKHTVSYNPLSGFYVIYFEEDNNFLETNSFSSLKDLVSNIDYKLDFEFEYEKDYEVNIVSYLKKIYVRDLDKEFNLEALWKYKKPHNKKGFNFYEAKH